MLYFWLCYLIAVLIYSIYLVKPRLISLGMVHMSERQKVPSYWHLLGLTLKHTAQVLPGTLLRPAPLIVGLLGLGLSTYLGWAY